MATPTSHRRLCTLTQTFNDSHVIITIAMTLVYQTRVIVIIAAPPEPPKDVAPPCVGLTLHSQWYGYCTVCYHIPAFKGRGLLCQTFI